MALLYGSWLARAAAALDLALLVVVGNIFGGLSDLDVAAVGHVTAMTVAAAVPRFDPAQTLRLIEKHRVNWLFLVPTMMLRIWRLPEAVRPAADVSSLQVAFHLAAPCPPWLKQAWIDWLGPEKVLELYAGTELQAATVITGTEWLAHGGQSAIGRVTRTHPSGRRRTRAPSPLTFSNRAGAVAAISFGRPVLPPLVTSFHDGDTPGVNEPAGSRRGTDSGPAALPPLPAAPLPPATDWPGP